MVEDEKEDGEDGDREGFSLQAYRKIKRNNVLATIVKTANANKLSIRNKSTDISDSKTQNNYADRLGKLCVYNINPNSLDVDHHSNGDPPFTSFTIDETDQSDVEVILKTDFFEKILRSGIGPDLHEE